MHTIKHPFRALNGFTLQIPENPGTRIISAKGSIRYLLQIADEHMDIPNVEKKEGQTFDIAGCSVKLTRMLVQNGTINLALALTAFSGPGAVIGPPGMAVRGDDGSTQPVMATLLDANGKALFNSTVRVSMSTSLSGNFAAPLKLRLSVPTKTKDVTYSFELQDLPLP